MIRKPLDDLGRVATRKEKKEVTERDAARAGAFLRAPV